MKCVSKTSSSCVAASRVIAEGFREIRENGRKQLNKHRATRPPCVVRKCVVIHLQLPPPSLSLSLSFFRSSSCKYADAAESGKFDESRALARRSEHSQSVCQRARGCHCATILATTLGVANHRQPTCAPTASRKPALQWESAVLAGLNTPEYAVDRTYL